MTPCWARIWGARSISCSDFATCSACGGSDWIYERAGSFPEKPFASKRAHRIIPFSAGNAQGTGTKSSWQEEFGISQCNLLTTGRNAYFVLEPGFQLVLEGDDTRLQITVLEETKTVDGVITRVVEGG